MSFAFLLILTFVFYNALGPKMSPAIENQKAYERKEAIELESYAIKVNESFENQLESIKPRTKAEYEGDPSCAFVSPDRMNVFYIGVENPISVSASGVHSDSIEVSVEGDGGLKLTASGRGKYSVTAVKPTKLGEPAIIVVKGSSIREMRFPFRVKRIPDPVAKLGGNKNDGLIGSGEFKAQRGLLAVLDRFDFDARCEIIGFSLTRIERNGDPRSITNKGGIYQAEAKRLVSLAKPGDLYLFDNVRVRCPGDVASRKINSLVFKVR